MKKKVKEKVFRLGIIVAIALLAIIFIFWNSSQKSGGIRPVIELPENVEII